MSSTGWERRWRRIFAGRMSIARFDALLARAKRIRAANSQPGPE